MIDFTNSYTTLPERFYSRIRPERFRQPRLLIFNEELGRELGIQTAGIPDERLAEVFSGQTILDGSDPVALVYAAHQFGHWVPRLGDGRAHLLGETGGFDIQLKGSGRTIFSRNGDGRSALGPVLREYIVSEAMHALGVPTTRALAAVVTGEPVYRQDGPEPGGIFTRVASSHIRVGTFQYFASRQDHEGVEILFDYTLKRHYPELQTITTRSEQVLEFIRAVGRRQARLIADWMSYGFIHGVMNTDNYSIAGITIDYGPCAFLDEYQSDKVFSSIDRHGRYSFSNQAAIAQWNLLRLAECLIPLIDPDPAQAGERIQTALSGIPDLFAEDRVAAFARKLGLDAADPESASLIDDFLHYLEQENLDFTLAFRQLPALFEGGSDFHPETEELKQFTRRWKSKDPDVETLTSINPLCIPRNHMIQWVIDHAYQGDFSLMEQMVQTLKEPFSESPGVQQFARPPEPGERVYQTFCGT